LGNNRKEIFINYILNEYKKMHKLFASELIRKAVSRCNHPLCFFKGFANKQISELLKTPIGTIKTRKRKALVLLEKLIA
jgi:hypothetical protein